MIYLVEDDANIRELVTYTLNHSGLDATGFERPSQFWKAMEGQLPDLVLLDIMLPEEDGLSILRRLRAAPSPKGKARKASSRRLRGSNSWLRGSNSYNYRPKPAARFSEDAGRLERRPPWGG